LRAVFILCDGTVANGTALVNGLYEELPKDVITSGGLAGDGERFETTWVADENGMPTTGQITAVGLYGDNIDINAGCQGGWDLFGPERIITRSSGNVLYEIDHKPALELYKTYLGERASELPASALLFPLAISSGDEDRAPLVRTILGIDEEQNSLTFAGDVPEGWTAQLMRANLDHLVDGAYAAGTNLKLNTNHDTTLSVAISCVGRRLILGQRAEEETEALLDALPSATRQIGFYSYGELTPSGQLNCQLHNQTMTVTTISERRA